MSFSPDWRSLSPLIGGAWSSVSTLLAREEPFLYGENDRSAGRSKALTPMPPSPGPIVRFMLQHVALLPPTTPLSPNAPDATPELPLPIACRACPPTHAGGFSPSLGILLCQNRMMSKSHMEDALTHELVHAWDGRRFAVRGEWGEDLRAHACTEVRWFCWSLTKADDRGKNADFGPEGVCVDSGGELEWRLSVREGVAEDELWLREATPGALSFFLLLIISSIRH